MKFVKTDELKNGVRIARPIYNKKGVLLYDAGSKLTSQAISSIRNFGLIGIFVLDDAEPIPPMSEEDIEFERFKTIKVYEIMAEFKEIISTHRTHRLEFIINDILSKYGHTRTKMNFLQDIRSKEDYVYKHTLNVTILAALMLFHMNVQPSEKLEVLSACMIHDIGKLTVPDNLLEGQDPEDIERILDNAEETGLEMVDTLFPANPNVRRICVQSHNLRRSIATGREPDKMKILTGTRVLTVADAYDTMTSISTTGGKEPLSNIAALRHINQYPEVYNKKAVEALNLAIDLLPQGTSVQLSNGSKALVLSVNQSDVLKPMVLDFSTNRIMDLSSYDYSDITIEDVVKTMDSRHVLSKEQLAAYGIKQ